MCARLLDVLSAMSSNSAKAKSEQCIRVIEDRVPYGVRCEVRAG